MSALYKSTILLDRKDTTFTTGFCLIKSELPELIDKTSVLHPNEIKYYQNLKFDKRKASYLLGRIAAKNAISEILQTDQTLQSIAIQSGVFQFPVVNYVLDQNIQVSISHCDDYGIALAFPEEHPLGIDIERIDEQKIDTIKNVISDQELNIIDDKSLPSVLITYPMIWTMKESLSKVLKTGLTIDLKLLEIDTIEKKENAYISTFKYFSQYKAISFQMDHYIFSISLPRNSFLDINHIIACIKQ